MVFLNPTILLGLLAASIPVILHFFNLRKIKKIEFSTLAFLKELQKSKIRKIKIKQLFLLLLRILIIIFLVLAFARPTLESTNIGGISSKAKTTAVIILDNSFSMSVVDENGSFLNQAKKITKELVSSFQTGDDVYLILSSNSKEISLPSLKTIDNIEVSYVTFPLNKSLLTASEIIEKSNNFNKEIYLFSDFQKSTFFENDSANNKINFTDTRIYFFRFGNEAIKNLSVTNLKINNQIFELNKEIDLTSELTNYSASDVTKQLNALIFNGKRIAQKSVTVTEKTTQQIPFKATIERSGLIEIVSELEDDDIKYDNAFYNYIIVPNKIDVLLVGNSIKDLIFVKAALQSNTGTVFNIKQIEQSKLNSINLSEYNSIIISGFVKRELSKTVKEYIQNGGDVVLFPADNFSLDAENKFLEELNIPKIKTMTIGEKSESINSFAKIDFSHPIFSTVFNVKSKEVESPQFYKYLKFTVGGVGKNIISLQDNSAFLSEFRIGKGKVLFFNIAPSTEWSDFPLKNIFAPLINRSVTYLASNFPENKSFIVGQKLWVDISRRKLNQIKAVRPDGSEELININNDKDNYLTYTRSDLIGIYKFYSENLLLDVKTVNFNVAESNLELFSSNEILELLKKKSNNVVEITPSDNYKKNIATARYGSELWQLFLITALVLALVEMFVARSSKKDLAELQ